MRASCSDEADSLDYTAHSSVTAKRRFDVAQRNSAPGQRKWLEDNASLAFKNPLATTQHPQNHRPAGDYSSTRLANTGIGHGTIGLGGAYTYLNPATGNEFSATAGFAYNFKNPDTQYRNGIDFHFDWGAAHFISKQVFVGLAGYADQQITTPARTRSLADSGRAFSASVRRSGMLFPWETCRASWA
jgi:hypothetical protein